MDKKDSFTSSTAHSTPPYLNTSISWGLPTEPNVRSSTVTQSLSLKVDVRSENLLNTKKISFQDPDSSSTQSTGQSSTEVASSGDDNPSRQISFSAHSDVCRGFEETQRKGFANNIKSGSSTTGISDIHFAPSKPNFSFHYADPHFGGLMPAAYLPLATVSTSSLITCGAEDIDAKTIFAQGETCNGTLCSEAVPYSDGKKCHPWMVDLSCSLSLHLRFQFA